MKTTKTNSYKNFFLITLLALGVSFLVLINNSASANPKDAEKFISSLADEAVMILKNNNLTENQAKDGFSAFISNGFDIKTIGRFALGPYWRSADNKQREKYISIFFSYIVQTYSERFRQYQISEIKVTGSRSINESETIVSSLLIRSDSLDIHLDWHVRFSNGEYKVVDVLFEGLRLGLSLRDQFSTIIRSGGGSLDTLIEELNNRKLR